MTDRRGNGLLADSYVPLILLTPVLADTMLAALGRAGIAAYAVPLDEDVLDHDERDEDASPTDHLYVDANERRAAEEVLWTQLPELAGHSTESSSPSDEPTGPQRALADPDEVWSDLVARFYESESSDRAWPDAENVPAPQDRDQDRDADEPPEDAGTSDTLTPPRPEPLDKRPDPDEEHYVPPPPPPLPRGDLISRLAWSGLLGGPALLLVATVVGLNVPGWLVLVVLGAFVSGFVVLLVRMGDRPPRDSGPDDGAVI